MKSVDIRGSFLVQLIVNEKKIKMEIFQRSKWIKTDGRKPVIIVIIITPVCLLTPRCSIGKKKSPLSDFI